MQRLRHVHQVGRVVVFNGVIEHAYRIHADNLVERDIVGKRLVHFLLLHEFGRVLRVFRVESHHQQSIFEWQQIPNINHSGRWSQHAVEVVANTVEGVEFGVHIMRRFEQIYCICKALTLKHFNSL